MDENRKILCTQPGIFEFISEKIEDHPGKGCARIKIRRIGICGSDYHAFRGEQTFFSYPRVLGHELAGEIVDVNPDSDNGPRVCKAGDRVTVLPYIHCGTCGACRKGKSNCCEEMQVLGVHIDGGMTEYLDIPLKYVIREEELSLDALTLIEPLSIGQHAISRAGLKNHDSILVIGTGPIGYGVIFLLHYYGYPVIAMDIDERRLAFLNDTIPVPTVLKSSSAFQEILEINDGSLPNVVMDATGNSQSMNASIGYMSHGGKLVFIGHNKQMIQIEDPEFHKKETTLLGSRNAKAVDFKKVITILKDSDIDIGSVITRKLNFYNFIDEFNDVLTEKSLSLKVLIDID